MKKIISILSIVICVQITTSIHAAVHADIKNNVKNYFNQLSDGGFSGNILVEHKGEIIFLGSAGFSDKDKGIKINQQTVFDIGSLTKQFTAAAILKLQMNNKLSVQDTLSKYFDQVPQDKAHITLHQLLTHSSGLTPSIGDDYESISDANFTQKALAGKLLFQPGTQYEYSNVGYSLLTLIIEQVSGESYETYLHKHLWQPSGMFKTGYTAPQYKQETIAIGYQDDRAWGRPNEKSWNKNAPFLNLKGNGGLLSTVMDLYHWHKALSGSNILSNTAQQQMYQKHIPEGEGANSFYGYGWAIFPTARQTELIAHNGGNGIFFADMWRYLTEDLTIIVLTNKANDDSERITGEIAQLVLNP
ncbi:serine hydrolase domain-containing protein [Marinicella sp. W31]|uniref:serine hydrolase domain-containing protein n=1 Tax=Marinicella sp. W31 TaxID=3023713 RepID=UPI003756D9F4